jgi:hypothetical protein
LQRYPRKHLLEEHRSISIKTVPRPKESNVVSQRGKSRMVRWVARNCISRVHPRLVKPILVDEGGRKSMISQRRFDAPAAPQRCAKRFRRVLFRFRQVA